MSPEVICRMNHSYEADFFALGVITYELMFGTVRIGLFRDRTWGRRGSKFDRKYSPIKPGSARRIFRLTGILLVLIL